MWRALLVGVGGCVGSLGRYWVAGLVQNRTDSELPLGTLCVNVIGSLFLGLIASASLERGLIGPEARLLLAVGFCGGFTTMSTFSYESVSLLGQGAVGLAAWNMILNLVVCLAAVWIGLTAGRLL
jgi:fluoride exporter